MKHFRLSRSYREKEDSSDLSSRFEKHLKSQKFFKQGETLLLACSGGADSVGLFYLLKNLAQKWRWKIKLLHFNHNLRPRDAKKDENFVRKLAKTFNLECYVGHGKVSQQARKEKMSIEECARGMRYQFFRKVASRFKNAKIVFAHTRDDQAETILMRILQGTGLRGLLGIREKTKVGKHLAIRPLLAFYKKDILSYLKSRRLSFQYDTSNDSLQFVRNRIRLKLIPELKRSYNPQVVEALSRLAWIARHEHALASELDKMAWKHVLGGFQRNKLTFKRSSFSKFPAPLQFRLTDRALKKLDSRSGLSFQAWEKIHRHLPKPRYRCSLPRNIDFSLTPKSIILYKN